MKNNCNTTVDLWRKTPLGREHVAELRVGVKKEHVYTAFYVPCKYNLDIMRKADAADYVRYKGFDYHVFKIENPSDSEYVVIYGAEVRRRKFRPCIDTPRDSGS